MEYKEFTIEISFIGEGYNVVLSEPKQLSEDLQLFFGEFLKGDKGDKGDAGEGIPQTLELSGRTLSISGGNSVNLPEGFSGRYQDLIGKPTLSTVATTGNYLDLFNKPTIPSSINDLSDVSVSTPADGQTLKYNNTTHKWENAEIGPNDFVCTFTADMSGDDISISCNKTITEIQEAFSDGSNIIGKLPLYNSSIYIIFQFAEIAVTESMAVAFVSSFRGTEVSLVGMIDDTDVWSYNETTFSNIQADWEEDDPSEDSYINNKPSLGTAAALDVAESGNASTTQVVKGDDSRLSDSRNAADVYSWAKAATKPSYSASEVGAIPSTDKGANGGVAELDSNGKVPSSQLPSYVDDVIEAYYNTTDHKMYEESTYTTEITPATGKIYVDLLTNKTYRWGGSAYTEISESLALGETSSTAYAGDKGKANADAIAAIKDGTSINSFGDVETALSGKQATIDASHKLSADLISDGSTNKVYTATEQSKLAGIAAGAEVNVNADWNASSGDAQILNKPTIPDPVSGTNDGTNWTSLTIGDTTKAIPSGGGGSSTLSGLTDTNISSASDGQALVYDNTNSKWINANKTLVTIIDET